MRIRTKLRWGTVAIALAAGPIVGTAVALAEVVKYDSKLTISRALPLYHGKLKAEFRKCVRGRRVTLFERQPGQDRKIGRDRTNKRGRWVVKVPLDELEPQDRFYARVGRKLNIVSGEGYVCRGDRSRVRTFVGD